MIADYLAELHRALGRRFLLRGRLLAEAKGHLEDSADELRRAGMSMEDAEREAVARFGPARVVAEDAVRASWPRSLVAASLILVAALVLHVLPAYGIPENTLPPAPWETRPDHLTWKLYASLAAYAAAWGAGIVALVASWLAWTRVAAAAFTLALGAFATSSVLGVILTTQWAHAAPGSGTTLALAIPAAAFSAGVAASAAAVAAIHMPR